MQLYQLRYVLAVAKYRSFSKTAAEIKISQSALSQHIINLEKELGVDLFVRTTRSVRLTSAGADFVKHATRVIEEMDAAYRCIQDYVALNKRCLSIGITPIASCYPVPKLLSSFQREFTDGKLILTEGKDEELIDMMSGSALDAVIIQKSPPEDAFVAFPLYADVAVLVTSLQHPLSFRKHVSLKELCNESFIVPPLRFEQYRDFEKVCESVGFSPKTLMASASVATALSLVKENMGITLLPSRSAETGADGSSLSVIGLMPTIENKLYLAIRKNSNILPMLKMFVQHVANWNTGDQPAKAAGSSFL
ncbi:MAG: LysR family transcriptional regulator [Synergistaceae bacterium]|jgi:DNA-binding transcriptional LysR family regulator|nr:LysR family transcriptional regulator [Synergistaceae bacterium]